MAIPQRFTRTGWIRWCLAAALACASALACAPEPARHATPPGDPFLTRRLALVRSIEAAGVRDSSTLAAIRAVPRHEFVPAEYREFAYADEPLPIEHDQTISQPYIVAFMTETLEARPGMSVLEIGTGSGYQAAVLSELGCRVHTIEIIRELADSARTRLARLGYAGVQVKHGDGYLGWPEVAPFDRIIVTAAPEQVPEALIAQLAPNGRLVAPVGEEHGEQTLVLIEKDAQGAIRRKDLLPVRFVPMRKGTPGS